MRILFVGDVVGRPGRDAVSALLPKLRDELKIDLAIVNGENAAGGAGLTAETARELQAAGADVVTTGNHIWDQRQFMSEIETLDFVLRPVNLAENNPGLPTSSTDDDFYRRPSTGHCALEAPTNGITSVATRRLRP